MPINTQSHINVLGFTANIFFWPIHKREKNIEWNFTYFASVCWVLRSYAWENEGKRNSNSSNNTAKNKMKKNGESKNITKKKQKKREKISNNVNDPNRSKCAIFVDFPPVNSFKMYFSQENIKPIKINKISSISFQCLLNFGLDFDYAVSTIYKILWICLAFCIDDIFQWNGLKCQRWNRFYIFCIHTYIYIYFFFLTFKFYDIPILDSKRASMFLIAFNFVCVCVFSITFLNTKSYSLKIKYSYRCVIFIFHWNGPCKRDEK